MNVSAPWIRRPVATTLVMASVLLFGFAAYRALPVSDLPNVDFPTLLVTATLPGASPETMASSVATPLERQFSTIAGISSMSSTNTLGTTQIILQFDLSRNLDAAAQDVQAAITAASGQLPSELPNPPSYRKVNPADQPVLYLALTSASLPLSDVDEYGETLLAQQISMVPGVAQVMVYGSQKYAVRVQLDPRELASRGIGIEEVGQAIQAANVNLPTGHFSGTERNVTIESEGQLFRAADYRPLIVAYRDGSPVRLEALGRVIDSVEQDETGAWYIDQPSVVLAIQRQPGTNTVAVTDGVRALLPAFRDQLPAAVSLHVLYDRSESIRHSVRDVQLTLLFTIALVVLVIFVFLRDARATLIPSLALPLSLIGTFAVMYLLGYSLDNLSLMALTLSVGLVVDDAIVVLENIVRHLEMGKNPLQAAFDGSGEIGFTVISMTISLIAVFIPVLFLGGVLGRLFEEFAVTIAVALLISGVVSLTLTPMLSSRFLQRKLAPEAHHVERLPGERAPAPRERATAATAPGAQRKRRRLFDLTERGFEWSIGRYDKGLTWSLDHPFLVLAFALLVLIATVFLFRWVPKGFLPSEDQGQLVAFTEAQEGVSFEAMVGYQKTLADIVKADPEVESFMSAVGASGPGGGINTGVMFIRLVPRGERRSAQKILESLRPQMSSIPGIRVYPQIPPPIQLSGSLTRSQYQYTLQGIDTGVLYSVAPKLEARMREIPGLLDVTSDLRLSQPQIFVIANRDEASTWGITMEQIQQTLYSAYGSRQISSIYTPTNTFQVIMELEPQFRRDPTALDLLYLRSASGQLVPLNAIARLQPGVGPQSVNHYGQLPAVTISFNLAPNVAIGDAVAEVQAASRELLPEGISTRFQGAAQAFQASVSNLGLLLVLAILVIYIVLGILYESFVHPITILTALPFAGFGAIVTLALFGEELSVYAFVGVILLIGLVKKNGIMMVDFALDAEEQGMESREAIHRASLVRFRPIMMTTFAALVGALPIALGLGAGGESRRPLGLAVVGGLLFSQSFTLLVTPVFFLQADRFRRWASRRFRRGRHHEAQAV